MSNSFSPVEVEGAGVMAALSDVQADHDRKACAHDAVLPWSIIAGRSLDTRCRHPRYKETSDELGRVPISGQRVSLDRAATPPGPLMAGVGVDCLGSTEYTQIRKGGAA